MPVVSEQVVQPRQEEKLNVQLEPAQALFSDLFLLDRSEKLPGLDRWVERTMNSLDEARLHTNHQVLNGLYYALLPRRSYPDFPSYLQDLAQQDPATWVDRLIESYERIPEGQPALTAAERERLLADFDAYYQYLFDRFGEEYVEVEVERQAHAWINEPAKMQRDALEHLTYMWDNHLKDAWQAALPLLQDCVTAFQQMEWPEGSKLEVAQWVTGQELNEMEQCMLSSADRVVFVPSTHVGPYLISLNPDDTLWLAFGARIPRGASLQSAALSRSQLLVRLNALADENRLHILHLLHENEELCAQDIIEEIELSQSSASRHLRQLSATGYILERRRESAKCYRLNAEQSSETVKALASFLGVEC